MKRFIRYLYEYEENQKKRNVGFVKVEQQEMKLTISVHGKGMCGKSNENISCYLIKHDSEKGSFRLIPAGKIRIGMPTCGGDFCYTEDLTRTKRQSQSTGGETKHTDEVCGVGLGEPLESFYIALWDEEMYPNFDIRKLSMEARMVEEPGEEPGEVRKSGEADSVGEEKQTEYVEEIRDDKCRIMKIQRGEISILPRCEWKLANNNFLLHGYYNYRHLVLIDEGDKLKLGVPGIYHEQEAKAAAAFGFPEFIGEDDIKIALAPQEKNMEQQFGYWCRQVRRPAK